MAANIRELMKLIPIGGFALHGTITEKIKSIRKEGLKPVPPDFDVPHFATIASPITSKITDPREYMERTIGGTLFAVNFAMRRSDLTNRNCAPEKLPAIILIRGVADLKKNGPIFKLGNDSEDEQIRAQGDDPSLTKRYRSFGKNIEHLIHPDSITDVIEITPEEFKKIWEMADIKTMNPVNMVRELLIEKTLQKMREAVRQKK